MYTNRRQYMPDDATGGGGTTSSLFEQLFNDKAKTLKGQNKENMAQSLKMQFLGGVLNAKGKIASLTTQLNDARGHIENLDLERIMELKDEIKTWNDQVASAKEEYRTMFGEEMPTSI